MSKISILVQFSKVNSNLTKLNSDFNTSDIKLILIVNHKDLTSIKLHIYLLFSFYPYPETDGGNLK